MKTQKKTKTLGFQIISFMFIFMLLLFLSMILITRQLLYNAMARTQEEAIANLAEKNVQLIDKNLAEIISLTKNLQTIVNTNIYSQEDINLYIHHLLVENPRLVSVCLAYDLASGKQTQTFKLVDQRISSVKAPDDDFLYKDWFQIPWLTRRPYWSDPWFDSDGSGQVVCSYSIPLNIKGKTMGIIRLDTPMESLRRIVLPLQIKKTGYAFLASSNGMIVAHPRDSLAMNYTIFDLIQSDHRNDLRLLARDAVSGHTGYHRIRIPETKSDNWIAYRPLPSNHWTLIVVVPHQEVFADLRYLTIIFAVASIIAFIILAGSIWYRIRTIHQPLTELVDSIKQTGAGDLKSSPNISSGTYEIQVIAENFELMKMSLTQYIDKLQLVTQEKNRILAEVIFASAVQRKLIPNNSDLSKLPSNLKAYGALVPAGEIGGDLYDYFLLEDSHFLFAIADVMGKGVAAAMTMTMMTTLLRTIAPQNEDPQSILKLLNSFLVENNLESDFVTMTLGIIDLKTGACVYSNAGHLPLYVLTAEGRLKKFADTHSTALGFFENIRISSETLQISPGDKIMVFTDGVTEAMGPNEELFGSVGLEKVLVKLSSANPETIAQTILSAVEDFADPQKPRDDTTILVIEYLQNLKD